MIIVRCQPGFELLLEQELAWRGVRMLGHGGGGWLKAEQPPETELCFAQAVLLDPVEVTGESVNRLAGQIADQFFATARSERFEGPWPFVVEVAGGHDGLGRRADAVAKAVLEILRKKMGRVARLAVEDRPRGVVRARGLYLFFSDFQQVLVSRECIFGGQRRMADDPLAPSRSYLKIEEAFVVHGREPQAGETVVDLGAAPGGWSYSAAKRGARVIAVDNGPLKGGALNHPAIEHRRADAFGFAPEQGQVFDWMFCDLVEEPHHVMRNLVEPWLDGGWCRHFVVILKFGRVDPIALLREISDPRGVLGRRARNWRVRHLYHDREEFSIVGDGLV